MADKDKSENLNVSPSMLSGARLNRKVIASVVAVVGIILLMAISKGLSSNKDDLSSSRKGKISPDTDVPGNIFSLPSTYADMYKPEDENNNNPRMKGKQSNDAMLQPVNNKEDAVKRAKLASNIEALKEEKKSFESDIIVLSSVSGGAGGAGGSPLSGLDNVGQRVQDGVAGIMDAYSAQNRQQQKQEFVDSPTESISYHSEVQNPVSPYVLGAGSIVPAALITGLNTDLPGQIVAQVRENVYDTPTGQHLLIPQGSRLIGRYDSTISYGQDRALLVWSHILFPDGSNLEIGNMQGADLEGFSGVSDQVNHHYWRLAAGVVMSSLLSIGATSAADDDDDTFYPSVERQIANDIAANISEQGQSIAERNLNIAPTITISKGHSFNVIVHKTLALRPYNDYSGSPMMR